jgi:hypothetical protein
MWDDDESDKSWRDPNAKKMTFDEMTARAQYEWQGAEDAEAEVRALHARADAPLTLAEALTVPEVRALVEALEWYGEQARLCRLIHSGGDPGRHSLQADGGEKARAALANLKGPTP